MERTEKCHIYWYKNNKIYTYFELKSFVGISLNLKLVYALTHGSYLKTFISNLITEPIFS